MTKTIKSDLYVSLYKKLQKKIDNLTTATKDSNLGSTKVVLSKNLNFLNQNISYIVHVQFFNTNTFIYITDIKGTILFFCSAGLAELTNKQKTKQPRAILKLLKVLKKNTKFLKKKPIAVHFKNVKKYYRKRIVAILKQYFVIETLQNKRMVPYNGCRPKKIKRKKRRTKKNQWKRSSFLKKQNFKWLV